jgi:hypothetical protein
MPKVVTATFVLTGPFTGKSCVLNGFRFVGGRAKFVGREEEVAGLATYFWRSYQAYWEDTHGKRHIPPEARGGEAARLLFGDGSDGESPPEVHGDDGSGAAPAAAGGEGLVPEGSGQEDPGVHAGEDPQLTRIKEAVGSLDPKNDEHWTRAGLPSITAVEEKLGSGDVNREMIARAAPGFNRDLVKAGE